MGRSETFEHKKQTKKHAFKLIVKQLKPPYMKQFSFFNPKSLLFKALLLSFVFIILFGIQGWAVSITWKGANGSNGTRWNVESNWSTNALPTSADDVIIPKVNSAPIITNGAVCNSITINTGASLTVNSGGSLTVSGSWTNDGTFTQNSGIVTFTGDTNAEITGNSNTTFSSLKVNKGNGKSAEIHLKGKGTVEVKSALIIDNGLMKIDSGGALNYTGTAAPTSGIAVTGGTYTVNGATAKATKTWLPTAGGNWTTAANWSPSGEPAVDDDVIIPKDQTGNITNIPTRTFTSVTINGTCTFFTNGPTITISGSFIVAAGKTLQCGTTENNSEVNITLNSNATGTINGIVKLMNGNQTTTFTNNGNLTIAATGYIEGTGKFTLASGATLQIGSADGIISSSTTLGNLRNSGTRSLNAGASYVYNGSGNQSLGTGLPGTIKNLTLSGGGTKTMSAAVILTTNCTIEPGITLNPGAYTSTFSAGAILNVNGTLDFSDANGEFRTGTSGTSTLTMGTAGLIKTIDPNGLGPVTSGSLSPQSNGTWSTNLGSAGTVEYNRISDQPQPITAGTYYNLLISNTGLKTFSGAVTAANLTIKPEASATISSGVTVSVSNAFLIESSATGAGSLIIDGTLTGAGTKSVQRWLANDDIHLISSPVSAQGIKSFGDATDNSIKKYPVALPTEYDIANYNEPGDDWSYYTISGATGNFGVGQGYLAQRSASGKVTFTGGTINTGTISPAISRTSGTIYGWNCIGNPYTSALKARGTGSFLALASNLANLDPGYAALFIWNQSTGDYDQITTGSGELNIAVGQGFIIRAATSTSTVSFTRAMQVAAPTTEFKSAEIPWPSVRINVKAGEMVNNTIVSFNSQMTNGLDPSYDVGKLKGNPDLALYTKLLEGNADVDFAVQALPDVSVSNLRIPLGLDYTTGGEVSFTLDTLENFPAWNEVYLEDTQNKTLTQLNLGNAKYSTTVAANTKGAGRFNILFSKYSATGISNELAKTEYKVYVSNRTIYINGETSGNTQFSIFNIEGKQLTNSYAKSLNQNTIDASGLPVGVYILRISNKGRQQTAKLVFAN